MITINMFSLQSRDRMVFRLITAYAIRAYHH